MEEIAGRTALITGGALRIGRALAVELAALGANVIVHYRNSRRPAEELAGQLRSRGVKAWTVQADLAQPGEAEGLFERARSLAGSIQLLINSAAIFPQDTLSAATEESFVGNIRINALAPFVLIRCLAQAFEPDGPGASGAVLNFLDTRITDYDRNHASYHASKLLLFHLTRMSSLEFAPRLRVNAIAPGLILPPAGKDRSYLEGLAHSTPLQAVGQVEDITAAAVFLLRSSYVTGQVLFVDGGRHLRGSVYGL
jgi:pteridine reductase